MRRMIALLLAALMLVAMTACGAKIAGAGKGCVIVEGSLPLTGATYTILPDRIETATFLCACAACGGALTLRRTDPCSERAHRKRLPDFLLT